MGIIGLNTVGLDGGNVIIKKGGGATPAPTPPSEEDTPKAINDVTYYDYDGTVLYSYSADAFAVLADHPALPEREGLICQEWNWSFDEAHNYVSKYGKCDIGATYITDDGKTRIYIEIDEYNKGSVGIVFLCKAIGDIYIDWGAGGDIVTNTFTSVDSYVQMNHTYNNIGRYCILSAYHKDVKSRWVVGLAPKIL